MTADPACKNVRIRVNFPGKFNDQLSVGLIAQLFRTLHRCRRGQGSNSDKPEFFRLSEFPHTDVNYVFNFVHGSFLHLYL